MRTRARRRCAARGRRAARCRVGHYPCSTTVELKTNVFAAGRTGDVLVGVAEALHVGRRTQVWEVRMHREADERLMANFVCTQIVLA